MYIRTFSRYCRRFLIVFPLGELAIVAKDMIFDGIGLELKGLALVAAVRYFLLRNCLQPNMQWILRDSKCVLLSHGSGVDEGGIGRRLIASL